jgi:Glutathione S-transferase, N-terminal domain
MKVYGFGPTRSLRALWGLKELDADFEFIPVDLLAGEHKRSDFLRLNPAGKVPVLVDGDLWLRAASRASSLALRRQNRGSSPAPSTADRHSACPSTNVPIFCGFARTTCRAWEFRDQAPSPAAF